MNKLLSSSHILTNALKKSEDSSGFGENWKNSTGKRKRLENPLQELATLQNNIKSKVRKCNENIYTYFNGERFKSQHAPSDANFIIIGHQRHLEVEEWNQRKQERLWMTSLKYRVSLNGWCKEKTAHSPVQENISRRLIDLVFVAVKCRFILYVNCTMCEVREHEIFRRPVLRTFGCLTNVSSVCCPGSGLAHSAEI
jgi:hypothetical protein